MSASNKALAIYAGPGARALLQREGLRPEHVAAIPAAAGGPKGLMLSRLDQFLFGDWLRESAQPIDLVGASIGAWRMATACMADNVAGFKRLEHDYIRQEFVIPPGKRMPSADSVSEAFAQSLLSFYDGHVAQVLSHQRYKLHVVTSHGKHVLHRQGRVSTPLGYAGAFVANAISRKGLGNWLERVVFSTPLERGLATEAPAAPVAMANLPFDTSDIKTLQCALTDDNFYQALRASCSIPFALNAVHDIPGAPTGAYWDGGITDYHMHLRYQTPPTQVVLYPHFQQAVVPGWLDKTLKHRHAATAALDHMVVIAPKPQWVATLPNAKLPDRHDFIHYKNDFAGRVQAWQFAVDESQRLVDELQGWLAKPDMSLVQSL